MESKFNSLWELIYEIQNEGSRILNGSMMIFDVPEKNIKQLSSTNLLKRKSTISLCNRNRSSMKSVQFGYFILTPLNIKNQYHYMFD